MMKKVMSGNKIMYFIGSNVVSRREFMEELERRSLGDR